ncbi:MAG: peptidoglycan DD-metalloendopeptidase family protein [Methyloligellaceae bacterium]
MSGATQFEGLIRRNCRSALVAAAFMAALAAGGCSSGISRFDFPIFSASSDASNPQQDERIVTSALPPVPTQPVYGDGAQLRGSDVARTSSPSAQPIRSASVAPRQVARTPLPPVAQSRKPVTREVTIKRGDTLFGLARRHGVPVTSIKNANNMRDTRLREGETVIIPYGKVAAPATYTVQSGDSVYTIAKRLGVNRKKLAQHNGLDKPQSIRPGQVLRIPGETTNATPVRAAGGTTRLASSQPASVRVVRTTRIPLPKAKQKPVATVRVASAGRNVPLPASNPGRPKPRRALPAKRATQKKPTPTRVAALPRRAQPKLAKPKPMSGNAFRWPVRGRVISRYGAKPNGSHNDGINVAVPQGTSVKAAENGVVAYAGNELKGYGNLILVRHANGWVSAYAHNEKLMVQRGDAVRRGQIIAKAGKTGSVSQPQLHFELRKGSRPVNPLKHMADT